MSKRGGIVIWFFALSGFVFAQNIPPDADWQKLRAHQIPLVYLKMTLPKKKFYQGEKIDATLDFSNNDPDTYNHNYFLSTDTVIFHAKDALGHDLVDPLGKSNDWSRFWFPISVWTTGNEQLGHYTVTRAINENARFDQPGVYKLYAQASVTEGYSPDQGERVPIVSDPATITIVPLPPEKEKQMIAAAMQKIGALDSPSYPDAKTQEGITELNYLQTPAARDELIMLLGHPRLASFARPGLLAAPDTAAEAEHILAAVQAGKLTLDADGVSFYAQLKLFNLTRGNSPQDFPVQERKKLIEEIMKEGDLARQEITTAMIQATAGQGQAHIEALWTAFEVIAGRTFPGDGDSDGGVARAALAEHQLELPAQDIKKLFANWPEYGSADFLPLVRREVKSRGDNPNALIALCRLSPGEARPLVLAERVRPDSLFFKMSYRAASIPPMPLPELDELFLSKLIATQAQKPGPLPAPNDNGRLIIPLICSFGSDKLLPELLAFSSENNPQWGNDVAVDFYLYWLRCDPKDGAAAFDHYVESGNGYCWSFLGPDLLAAWRDQALPAVRYEIRSADVQAAFMAFILLEKHGDDTDIDPMIGALDRFGTDENFEALALPSKYARQMLKSDRWHLTADQKKRLEALVSTP